MSMTPHATLKPWRRTIRGEKRDRHRHERRSRTRNAPPPRDLDDLTQRMLGTTASMLDEAHEWWR